MLILIRSGERGNFRVNVGLRCANPTYGLIRSGERCNFRVNVGLRYANPTYGLIRRFSIHCFKSEVF